jgi:hypothetical protein
MQDEFLPKARASVGALRDLPRPIQQVLESGIDASQGCVLLTSLRRRSPGVDLSDFPDRTGLECYVNKLSIEDYVSGSASSKVAVSLKYLRSLAQSLQRRFPKRDFRFILTVDGKHCTVRFHVVREGEEFLGDLANYDAATGVLEVAPEDLGVSRVRVKARRRRGRVEGRPHMESLRRRRQQRDIGLG